MAEEHGRSRLGRGLAALIGDMGSEAQVAERSRSQRKLPIEFLRANPRNPRRTFDSADLDDLSNSVREKGIVQPILVRRVPDAMDAYEIIAGERRWRAAQRAGLHEVPVLIHDVGDKEALELAIVENVQRTDLNPLEEALGYQQLIAEFGYSQVALADVIGKSRPHVANKLRLLKLPQSVLDYIRDGRLSAGGDRRFVAALLAEHPEMADRVIVAGAPRPSQPSADGESAPAHTIPKPLRVGDLRRLVDRILQPKEGS